MNDIVSHIPWRDTGRPIRFFFLDARVLAGLLLWALHMTVFTFVCAVICIIIFSCFEFFGYTPVAACRAMKNSLFSRTRRVETAYPFMWRTV